MLTDPKQIEQESFRIIRSELGNLQLPKEMEPVIIRVIHTTADFDYARSLVWHPDAPGLVQRFLKSGCGIYTDTAMAASGINKTRLSALGCSLYTFVHDPAVASEAAAQHITRSMAAVRRAAADSNIKIFIFGNAPTALEELLRLYAGGKLGEAVVIGVPVGFVGASDSKEHLCLSGLPYLTALGRKGGSNVAAAILNAFLYKMENACE